MKKQILILAFLIISLSSFSQGNLQFNQVLTFSRSINTSSYVTTTDNMGAIYAYVTYTDTTLTVTTGKIWKIEKMDGNLTFNSTSTSPTGIGALMINNAHKISVSQNNGVVWLKSGDKINMTLNNDGGGRVFGGITAIYTNLLSIIEFNVVQ